MVRLPPVCTSLSLAKLEGSWRNFSPAHNLIGSAKRNKKRKKKNKWQVGKWRAGSNEFALVRPNPVLFLLLGQPLSLVEFTVSAWL